MLITLVRKSQLNNVPPPVRLFAKRALLLLLSWILMYHVILKPYRIPDRWLSNSTATSTAKLLSLWYAPASFIEKDGWACVVINERSAIRIGDPCNGLDLIILYIGFMICMPTSKKRLLTFSILGTAAIFLLNVLRCAVLAWLSLNKHEWIDFAHKYAFTAIVYCCIFYGWVLYIKQYKTADVS